MSDKLLTIISLPPLLALGQQLAMLMTLSQVCFMCTLEVASFKINTFESSSKLSTSTDTSEVRRIQQQQEA